MQIISITVTERLRPLEPVTPDPFIMGLDPTALTDERCDREAVRAPRTSVPGRSYV